MTINDVKVMVDKADTIKRQLEGKDREMDEALGELSKVQKKIASIGQDQEKLRLALEEVENELRPVLVSYIKKPALVKAIHDSFNGDEADE